MVSPDAKQRNSHSSINRNGSFEASRFTINLITPDNGEKFLIELSNATLTNIEGYLANNADLTLFINRTDLEQTMMGVKTMEAQIADGKAKVESDTSVLGQPASTLVVFDPRFEILPGTATRATEEDLTDYEGAGTAARGVNPMVYETGDLNHCSR